MDDLDRRLAALPPEKRDLFLRLVRNPAARPPAADPPAGPPSAAPPAQWTPGGEAPRMDFSLFFFSDDAGDGGDRYRLVREAARFADEHGFTAVWTPERHFHPFGGLYPNPAVLGAALAMVTTRLELRAGSVVLPLHDPLRVVEEWSVVDNLSGGRAALALASGWHADDFVLAPHAYAARKEITFDGVATLRALWGGGAARRAGPDGREVEVRPFPPPVRRELPLWITAATSAETFVRAGELGCHLLTGLTGQRVDELAAKVASYRAALAAHGHDPAAHRVAVMLHAYLGDDVEAVKEAVRPSMYAYLRTNLGLHRAMAERRSAGSPAAGFTGDDEDAVLHFAFERYFGGGALFGTPESCLEMVERMRGAGVDEIACLVDFGLDAGTVMAGLERLAELRARCEAAPAAASAA